MRKKKDVGQLRRCKDGGEKKGQEKGGGGVGSWFWRIGGLDWEEEVFGKRKGGGGGSNGGEK